MARPPKFDPRKLMERAIAAMLESVSERRDDGKACPKVGAVLWQADGKIQTACRGELREGDHAEFTLIERKNRDRKLDGSKLFATLEPCAPGARKAPKLGCAERIVNARITEVWVGIEDPDPTVDRKGIKFLQDRGITVHMFDRDLQAIIRDANKDFIIQAKERAAEQEEPPLQTKLSTLEDVAATASIEDLDPAALERYRESAKIIEPVGSRPFNAEMVRHDLLHTVDGRFVPTRLAVILFAKSPRMFVPQAGLLATIRYPDGTEEVRDFDGPMIFVPEQVERWLRDKLPNVIDRNQMERGAVDPIPFPMIREAIVNALVHRDYDIAGAKCQLIVSPNTIVVRSPGAPVPPITLTQLQGFNAPMLSRNPELHYVFTSLGLAEERGLGLRTLRLGAAGLPLPTFSFDDPYLTLTLHRTPAGAEEALAPSVIGSLSDQERRGWAFLTSRSETSAPEYAKELGIPGRTAQRSLNKFVTLGLLEKMGNGRATRYVVAKS